LFSRVWQPSPTDRRVGHSHCNFRGLLRVHSRYGPHVRWLSFSRTVVRAAWQRAVAHSPPARSYGGVPSIPPAGLSPARKRHLHGALSGGVIQDLHLRNLVIVRLIQDAPEMGPLRSLYQTGWHKSCFTETKRARRTIATDDRDRYKLRVVVASRVSSLKAGGAPRTTAIKRGAFHLKAGELAPASPNGTSAERHRGLGLLRFPEFAAPDPRGVSGCAGPLPDGSARAGVPGVPDFPMRTGMGSARTVGSGCRSPTPHPPTAA
jgi:hypothetical protein